MTMGQRSVGRLFCPSRYPAFYRLAALAASLAGAQAAYAGIAKEATQETSAVTTEIEDRRTNRLVRATSPYLLQHARNPVDWYEWGPEAFEKAKAEDRPIFLSIGYAACHWCHVMEHESFESDEVADLLNRHFVSIKVDREERPDVDEIYMAFTQRTTGGGGWPMSVWLTPDGTPFYAGTYFPASQLMKLLDAIIDAWQHDRDQILAGADNTRGFFEAWSAGMEPAEGVPPRESLEQTAELLARHFDRARGGISGGGTNKFPPSMAMDLLLRVHRTTGNADLLEAVELTLDHMARGGIYDHIGGGICRYSTDREWLVPHFEKMLYDQAMVASIYLDAYQVTRDPRYAAVAADIFDYVITDLQSPEGGFYSSRDADSEGLEGAFYIWTVEQIHELLGPEDGPLFCAYFDATPSGNWHERLGHAPAGPKNILHIRKAPGAFAREHGLDLAEFERQVETWRSTLRQARSKRVAPGLDDKILTAWNGLMIASLAKGGRVLNRPEYAEAAAKSARFLLERLRRDGRLLRTYRNGDARLTGYLNDYSFLIEGLLNLYEARFERTWLAEALELTDTAVEHYFDEQGGAFFFTADDGEKLIARSKNPHDSAIPSGNSVMAMNLLRLAILFDRKDLREKAESIFRTFGVQVAQAPPAFERLLCALDFYHDGVKEIAIVGSPPGAGGMDTAALVRTIYDRYLPNKVVVHARGMGATDGATDIPLLRGKGLREGRATAYVCQNYSCKLPVTSPDDLAAQLDAK
jgi:uncharacterized protein YyaL (SSP411 family)